MRTLLTDTIKYVTNHIINHIPSYIVRDAWYRNVLGWHIEPEAVICMGLYMQIPGLWSSRKKVSIGKGSVINYGCRFHAGGGILIGENVSISAGVWLITGTHDINHPQFAVSYKP